MEKDGWAIDIVRMRYHKEEQLNIGTEACYVKHCNSTRPAYVWTATKDDKAVDLMYLYQPMGLARQYGKQGSILGRFFNREVALSFLQVASQELGMKYTKDSVSLPIMEQAMAKENKTAASILEQWETAKKSFAIEETELSLNSEFKHLQPVESWSTLTSLLRIVAPKVHKKRLEWLLEKNDESIG